MEFSLLAWLGGLVGTVIAVAIYIPVIRRLEAPPSPRWALVGARPRATHAHARIRREKATHGNLRGNRRNHRPPRALGRDADREQLPLSRGGRPNP